MRKACLFHTETSEELPNKFYTAVYSAIHESGLPTRRDALHEREEIRTGAALWLSNACEQLEVSGLSSARVVQSHRLCKLVPHKISTCVVSKKFRDRIIRVACRQRADFEGPPIRKKTQNGPAVRISSAPATSRCEPPVPFVFFEGGNRRLI